MVKLAFNAPVRLTCGQCGKDVRVSRERHTYNIFRRGYSVCRTCVRVAVLLEMQSYETYVSDMLGYAEEHGPI